MAARSKFTAENRQAVIARLQTGMSLTESATAAGLPKRTVTRWLTQGRKEKATEFADFARAVDAIGADGARPLTFDDFRERLDKAVRGGSVQAMKLWWEIERAQAEPPEKTQADPADEIAQRRAARAA